MPLRHQVTNLHKEKLKRELPFVKPMYIREFPKKSGHIVARCVYPVMILNPILLTYNLKSKRCLAY